MGEASVFAFHALFFLCFPLIQARKNDKVKWINKYIFQAVITIEEKNGLT
jgi:hypothetical protein